MRSRLFMVKCNQSVNEDGKMRGLRGKRRQAPRLLKSLVAIHGFEPRTLRI